MGICVHNFGVYVVYTLHFLPLFFDLVAYNIIIMQTEKKVKTSNDT